MKKSGKINLNTKTHFDHEACGSCFSIVDSADEYCWRCGAYFDVEVDNLNNFKELEEYFLKLK